MRFDQVAPQAGAAEDRGFLDLYGVISVAGEQLGGKSFELHPRQVVQVHGTQLDAVRQTLAGGRSGVLKHWPSG
jgi:hypothetical protein